jgi:hypothetical protein
MKYVPRQVINPMIKCRIAQPFSSSLNLIYQPSQGQGLQILAKDSSE